MQLRVLKVHGIQLGFRIDIVQFDGGNHKNRFQIRRSAITPFFELPAGFFTEDERIIQAGKQAGTVFTGFGLVILVDVEIQGQFVFPSQELLSYWFFIQ